MSTDYEVGMALGLGSTLGATSYDLGPEATLPDAKGRSVEDILADLVTAKGYVKNWYKAVSDSDDWPIWKQKIGIVEKGIDDSVKAMKAAAPFPGKAALALYAKLQLAYPAIWRRLAYSVDTLPRKNWIEKLAEITATIPEVPGAIVKPLADALPSPGKTIGLAVLGVVIIGGIVVMKSK